MVEMARVPINIFCLEDRRVLSNNGEALQESVPEQSIPFHDH